MPTATERITELRENADDGELPYISKSRLKSYVSCPRAFYYNYILGIRAPENWHMKKGTRIHLTYEKYYENVCEFYSENPDADLPSIPDDLVGFLPDDGLLWIDWAHPFVGNFISWELSRAEAALEATENQADAIAAWLPAGIESEAWDDSHDPPKMGFADVIVPAASVPEIDTDSGVVIVDFKTGSTPKKKYRDKGIFLEGTFYRTIFEDQFDVAGVAGYFPKNNDFLVSPLSLERQEFAAEKIKEIKENGDDKQNYEPDPGPLCRWSPEDDDKCDYYSMCHAGKEWGAPTENWDEFVSDVESGMSKPELSRKYWDDDQDTDSIHYWYWKAEQT